MSQLDSLKVAVQITKYEDGLGLWIDFKEIFARYNFGNPVFRSFDVNPRAKNDEWGVVSIVVDDETEPKYKLPNGFKNGIEVGEKRTSKKKKDTSWE